jgi:hypothetical protein
LEWYAVKLIYEFIITGEPNPEKIDEEYHTDKMYEESIMLVKAQSFNHAYSIAEMKAKESEYDYISPYDEKVYYKFAEAIDCFHLFDEELETGTELYSRFLNVSKDISRDEFIDQFYPETIEED